MSLAREGTIKKAHTVEARPVSHSHTGLTSRSAENVPAAVHEVLSTPGQPLDTETRTYMEQHLGHDFSRVRIHADSKATESARAINALAYTAGHDVVFGPGRYAPRVPAGRHLLAHELAHVAQTGSAAAPTGIAPQSTRWESDASQAASSIVGGQAYRVTPGAPALLYRRADPRLETYLARLRELSRELVGPLRTEYVADQVLAVVGGLDLGDRDNLTPVAQTVSQLFDAGVLLQFLERVEAARPARREPTPEDIARMERTVRLMQVGPRGPYRQYGPGVAIPVLSQAARPLLYMGRSIAAYFEGLLEGLRGNLSESDIQALNRRLLESQIVSIVLPVVITAGAAVGIVEDIVNAIRGVAEIIGNIREIARNMLDLLGLMVSEEGEQVARILGIETGRNYAQRVREMSRMGAFRFTYELGRLVGPMIVYTVLSILTAGAVAGAAVSARLASLLSRLPRFARLLERIGSRLRRLRPRRQPDAPTPPTGPLYILGGRRLLTQADMLRFERLGGHTLQRHGSHHTRRTLRDRIIGEREIPPPRTLHGGERTPDFRVWQGQRTGAASRWVDDDTMRRAVSDIVNDNIEAIERAARTGGPFPPLERVSLNRRVGEGWVQTAGAPAAERGVFWRDDLRRATVVIRSDNRGGWYVHTAYPE